MFKEKQTMLNSNKETPWKLGTSPQKFGKQKQLNSVLSWVFGYLPHQKFSVRKWSASQKKLRFQVTVPCNTWDSVRGFVGEEWLFTPQKFNE